MSHRHFIAALFGAAMCVARPAGADTITLVGSTIPLRDVKIEAVRAGELHYLDGRGQRQRRPLEEVRALGFSDLPTLDEAEAAVAAGDLDRGVPLLLQAFLKAGSDLERLWLHVRLSRVHDRRGEFLEAASHAGSAWLMEPDPYWRILEPLSEMKEDSPAAFPAAVEALDVLRRADAAVTEGTLARLVDRLLGQVEKIHARLRGGYGGPPIQPGTTVSGIDKRLIMGGAAAAPEEDGGPSAPPSPPAAKPGPGAPAPPPAPRSVAERADALIRADEALDDIEAAVQAGRFAEAVASCRLAEGTVHDESLARLLYQYGLALRGAGRADDAALMQARCAILFPQSPLAPASLIELSAIYRQSYRDQVTARRLLELAVSRAEALGKPALVERARRELGSMAAAGPP